MLWAIFRCNRWMLEQADVVVAYVTRSWGGTVRGPGRPAEKMVINLAQQKRNKSR